MANNNNIPFASATMLGGGDNNNNNDPYGGVTPMMPPPTAPSQNQQRPSLATTTQGRSSRVVMPSTKSFKVGTNEIKQLKQQGFTTGLAEAMTQNNQAFPLRIWVVDNSGSMSRNDGHRLIENKKDNKKYSVKFVDCTRWREITETVTYHVQMAALLKAPTVFRMLNDPGSGNAVQQQFSICERGYDYINEDVAIALNSIQNTNPTGVTPLSQHVREIQQNITQMSADLRGDGCRVAVILATDGLPTDYRGICDSSTKSEFVNALRSLEGLPVWVVIRLCTDEDDVVDFYNELDNQLELSLEVLDDFIGEGKEVNEYNKWLNYALPLHRCREMGYHSRLFDLLDERTLTIDELRDFCCLLFGNAAFDGVPDGQADWKGFCKSIETLLKNEENQWNPRTKRIEPWIDIKLLNKTYNKSSWFSGIFCIQ